MKYSVIIPAYNCEKTIETTVNSVLNSGLSDFEIIIVNDGSKDNTKKICDELSKKHNEITCIHKENSGVSSTRNRGIDESRGEYLLFIDADDTIDEKALEEPSDKIIKYNPDMLIFGLSFEFLAKNKVYRRDEMTYPSQGFFFPEQWSNIFLDLFNYNALSPAWNKFYRTEIIKKHNIRFNESISFMEDFLFVLDCMNKTESLYVHNKVVYRYYQPENDTRSFSRVDKLTDINTYIKPFVESILGLTVTLKEHYNIDFPQGEMVLFEMYRMFVKLKAYYADVETLKLLSDTIKNGRFSDYVTDDILINDLRNKNYKTIIKRNKKIQLRHKVAVTVKKTALYQKLKGN